MKEFMLYIRNAKDAKDNPEFEYVPSATIEVRPIKTKEVETGFIYPTKIYDCCQTTTTNC